MAGSIQMREEIITAEQHSINGILTYSSANSKLPVVVIFNAGVIHKVGPNRIHVKLARKLATEGYNAFRFDYGGQGDSIALAGSLYEEARYISKALNLLQKKTGVNEFILFGICSGAEDAYVTALHDDRIKGIVMVNGTGLDISLVKELYPEAEKQIQLRYYKKSLLRTDRWLKVLKGKSKALTFGKFKLIIRRLLKKRSRDGNDNNRQQRPSPFDVLGNKKVALLFIVSEGSNAFDMVNMAYNKNSFPQTDFVVMKDVDHIITPLWAQNELFATIIQWCNSHFKHQ
jgi:pimeloyl-ACP methyl ester carboxylesterase